MGQYSEAEHCLGFIHRDVMVDIYRRKKGATCCEVEYDLDDTSCFVCGGPLEPEDVYQICVADVCLPRAETPDETSAMELAMYIIDEYLDVIRDPDGCAIARFDIETDPEYEGWDDDGEDGFPETDPLPGSVGDGSDRTFTGNPTRGGPGRSDLLDGAGSDDAITSQLIEDALSVSNLSIVPAPQPPPRPGLNPPKDAARRAMIAKQIHELKWWRRAKRIIDAARKRRK